MQVTPQPCLNVAPLRHVCGLSTSPALPESPFLVANLDGRLHKTPLFYTRYGVKNVENRDMSGSISDERVYV